jgi:hypothetical protein
LHAWQWEGNSRNFRCYVDTSTSISDSLDCFFAIIGFVVISIFESFGGDADAFNDVGGGGEDSGVGGDSGDGGFEDSSGSEDWGDQGDDWSDEDEEL